MINFFYDLGVRIAKGFITLVVILARIIRDVCESLFPVIGKALSKVLYFVIIAALVLFILSLL